MKRRPLRIGSGGSGVARLQGCRFEFKYVIHPARVDPIRRFARDHLQHDPHAHPEQDWAYDVHSLYLDGPSYSLCRATLQGLKNRFKLRVRFYDDDPASPVFFEIKRRQGDVILKRRAKVRRESVDRLIRHAWPTRTDLCDPDDGRQLDALVEFCSLRNALGAQGRVFVSYSRTAFVSPGSDSVRMTFDHDLHGARFHGRFALPDRRDRKFPQTGGVVLELKFTDMFPNWMREMVEIFNLERTSFAKYVRCVGSVGAREPILPRKIVEAMA